MNAHDESMTCRPLSHIHGRGSRVRRCKDRVDVKHGSHKNFSHHQKGILGLYDELICEGSLCRELATSSNYPITGNWMFKDWNHSPPRKNYTHRTSTHTQNSTSKAKMMPTTSTLVVQQRLHAKCTKSKVYHILVMGIKHFH